MTLPRYCHCEYHIADGDRYNLTDLVTVNVQSAVDYSISDSSIPGDEAESNVTFSQDRFGSRETVTPWNTTSIPDIQDTDGNSTDVFAPNNSIAYIPALYGSGDDTARGLFNTSSVLTSTLATHEDQPVFFNVPRNTSLIRLFGSVGPDMGSYQVRMHTRDPYIPLNVSSTLSPVYNAYRPVYATGQLLHMALIDPDADWYMSVWQVAGDGDEAEQDKRIELNGAVYLTFLNDPKPGNLQSRGIYLERFNEQARERRAAKGGGGYSGTL